MRFKLALFFLITVLIPTIFLVYFSLLAVKGEKEIFESNLRKKYEAMVGIVLENVKSRLENIPEEVRWHPTSIEPVLMQEARLFPGEILVFNREGNTIGQTKPSGKPAYVARVGDSPYKIAVYERHPELLSQQFVPVQKKIGRHTLIVSLAAFAILVGGIISLRQLLREWEITQIKLELLSLVSHDLRRPLTSIRMFSEMLQHDRVPSREKKKEYYGIIASESEKLTHLANNLLDFSQMEHRKKKYNSKMEDLNELVADTVERFKNYFVAQKPQRKVTICQMGEPIPPFLMDAEALSHALLNLLTNADKYSPPDTEISIVIQKNGNKVEISVIDQGIGISKKEQKKIFEKFYRGKSPHVNNLEGMGLGLTLIKHAVRANRGKLRVKSAEGKGSEFTITLPIHEGERAVV